MAEDHAFPGEAVNVRRGKVLSAGETEIANADVIHEDDDDIGLGGRGE